MLYRNVEPHFVDPSWWPFIEQRARLLQMARELERGAAAFAARPGVDVYYFDEQPGGAPFATEADALAADHGPVLRSLLATIKANGRPAEIRFRATGIGDANTWYGFTSGGGYPYYGDTVGWIEPGMHGIALIGETDVNLSVDRPNDGDGFLMTGHKGFATLRFLRDGNTPSAYWGGDAGVLNTDCYDLAGQQGDPSITVPAGATKVTLVSSADAAQFQPGDRCGITWGQTLDMDGPNREDQQPLVHYARVTEIDGPDVHFWPPTRYEARVLPFPPNHTWPGENRPIGFHRLQPYTVERFGIWGEGDAKMRLYMNLPYACLRNSFEGVGLCFHNFEFFNRSGAYFFSGQGSEDLYVSDMKYTTRYGPGGRTAQHGYNGDWFVSLDKALKNAVIQRISPLDDLPTQQRTVAHIHEGVTDLLIRDVHVLEDDQRVEVSDSGKPVLEILTQCDSVWIENFTYDRDPGTNNFTAGGIVVDDNCTGLCGLVNVDVRPHNEYFTLRPGKESEYFGAGAYSNVRSGFNSPGPGRINDNNILAGDDEYAARLTELWTRP
jgi:hypothetical protein